MLAAKKRNEAFDNIPDDHLHLFNKQTPNVPRVMEFLNYQKTDIAEATGTPLSSIRYDSKMPSEIKERASEWASLLNLVESYFRNPHKTALWFKTPNPLLGNVKPRDMIRLGRFSKLQTFILNSLDENKST